MKFILVFMAALAAVGCSSHYSSEDLAGRYVLTVDGGVDTLELSANGTYTHTYKARSGASDHQEGRWTLESLQAGSTVALDDFRPLLAEKTRGRGTYLLLVKKSFADLYLITDIDLGEGYKKQQ
jgi:hypothetical protein